MRFPYFAAILNLDEGFAENFMQYLLRGVVPILVLVVVIAVAMRIASRRRLDAVQQKNQDLVDADEAANFARNRDIGEEFFYTPDLAGLPVTTYSEADMKAPVPPYVWQQKVVGLADKKMLRFDRQYSNIELKQMFGPSNLEFVARYEENFSNFIHAMRHWAEALLAAGENAGARRVLEESVSAGSELSQSYTLLANLYAAAGDIAALKELARTAEKSNMPGKNIAARHIDGLLKGGAQ